MKAPTRLATYLDLGVTAHIAMVSSTCQFQTTVRVVRVCLGGTIAAYSVNEDIPCNVFTSHGTGPESATGPALIKTDRERDCRVIASSPLFHAFQRFFPVHSASDLTSAEMISFLASAADQINSWRT